MTGFTFIDAYVRAFRTQFLRNGLGLEWGYYQGTDMVPPGSVTPVLDEYFPNGEDPWTLRTFISFITYMHDGLDPYYLEDLWPEAYPFFKVWVDTLVRQQDGL